MQPTLPAKHRSRVTPMARKYQAKIDTPHGKRTCFEAIVDRAGRKPLVARFGGIPLKRQKKAVLDDRPTVPATTRKELVTRLQAGRCEWCQRHADVGFIRSVSSLTSPDRDAHSPRGQSSWPKCAGRRSSSARHATSTSTQLPSRTRHKSLESSVR